MNLLNLIILIILFITIEPFIIFTFYNVLDYKNGLVFIKPENLTKTELVERFKELSSSKSLNELKKEEKQISQKDLLKSYYLKILSFLVRFYEVLIKISLFTFFIKYFRKIKLMRFIWTIINSIFLSTFGIVFSEVYGFKEIFNYVEHYWMEYVNFIQDSKFYKILVKLFNVVKDENKPEIVENKSEIVESKLEKVSNSEILENKDSYDFPSSDRTFKTKKNMRCWKPLRRFWKY